MITKFKRFLTPTEYKVLFALENKNFKSLFTLSNYIPATIPAVYSKIKDLERDGLINLTKNGRNIVPSSTEKGREVIENLITIRNIVNNQKKPFRIA